jgi:hypothetical protein
MAAMSQGLFMKRAERGASKNWTGAHLRHCSPLGVKKIKDEMPFDTNGIRRWGSTTNWRASGSSNDDGFDLGASSIVCLQKHGAGDSVGKW